MALWHAAHPPWMYSAVFAGMCYGVSSRPKHLLDSGDGVAHDAIAAIIQEACWAWCDVGYDEAKMHLGGRYGRIPCTLSDHPKH
jgi:hypothetical protein